MSYFSAVRGNERPAPASRGVILEHPVMTSAKYSDVLPFPPMSAFGTELHYKFTQTAFLCPLFNEPFPPPMRTSYPDAPYRRCVRDGVLFRRTNKLLVAAAAVVVSTRSRRRRSERRECVPSNKVAIFSPPQEKLAGVRPTDRSRRSCQCNARSRNA